MTKREFLKSELLKDLIKPFDSFNYKLNKTSGEVYKRDKEGWTRLTIIFLTNAQGGWTINTSIGIRKNSIEDIFHETSGFEAKYQKGTSTIGCFIEDYIKDYSNVRIALFEEQQLKEAKEAIINLFENVAKEYFHNFNNIKTIDDLLNSRPNEDTVHSNEIFRGSKGVITAKLTDRGNYSELVDIYCKKYEEFSNGFYLPAYKKLIDFLRNVEPINIS